MGTLICDILTSSSLPSKKGHIHPLLKLTSIDLLLITLDASGCTRKNDSWSLVRRRTLFLQGSADRRDGSSTGVWIQHEGVHENSRSGVAFLQRTCFCEERQAESEGHRPGCESKMPCRVFRAPIGVAESSRFRTSLARRGFKQRHHMPWVVCMGHPTELLTIRRADA